VYDDVWGVVVTGRGEFFGHLFGCGGNVDRW
jgi:hypothetical protein